MYQTDMTVYMHLLNKLSISFSPIKDQLQDSAYDNTITFIYAN